ncbi:MAG: hypothetical protein K0R45_3346, partial [Pseudomonas sp.]|nr:hypothetical protein [Pseudomonas sp.]
AACYFFMTQLPPAVAPDANDDGAALATEGR